ncbi:hypothetical protein E4U57_006710 [Claviceps arundinis]|uniref:Uncharacterized protein n=1 Tax=Claviceps arundinis TaxID=1623583 RepID=A0ABQ7PH20_9HYPO|nr:hypothetical protein E4U57_006710 [Claviceps arundinis]
MKTSLVLSTIIGAGLAAAAECPAPGSSDSQGRYSCNPAHQYPEGQQCKEIDGCLFLTDANGKPIINKTTSSGAAQPTSVCPAPGSSDSQGRYSCNPAHQYPEGQQCKEIDGCLFLCDANGQPATSQPASSGTGPDMPVVTAGAAALSGAGLLGLVGLAIALF